jgi:hypothetical protein
VCGIIMLLLFTYPIRKHFFAIRGIGKMRTWFKFHVFFGFTMTALLVYHTNFFNARSMNGKVAFYSIMIVATSGVVGRYLLRRAHKTRFWFDLFRHWHIAHIPVIYMALITVLVHVYAIHIY